MNDQYILEAREFENEQVPEILTAETVLEKVGDNNLILVDLRNEEALCVIGKAAFAGHGSMKAANFAGCSNLEEIGEEAFRWESKLKIVSFAGCEKLSEIGTYAFFNCSELREVRAAGCNNITSIGDSAFEHCRSLISFSVYDRAVDLFEFDINFRGYGQLETIGNCAFRDCKSIKTADFSCSGLTQIGGSAFSGCRSLEEISFNGCRCLTEIEGYAFSDCENLKCIYLSGCDNLTEIGNRVFSGCRSLEKIDLSGCHSLTEIGRGAFAGCEVLREILLPEEFFAGMTEQQQREKMNDILGYDVRFDIEREDGKYKITVDRQQQIMRRINEPTDFMPNDFMFIEDEMPRRANEEIAELMQEIELLREAELAQRGRQQPEQQHEQRREAVDMNQLEQQGNGRNRANARGQNAHIAQNDVQARQGQAQLQ